MSGSARCRRWWPDSWRTTQPALCAKPTSSAYVSPKARYAAGHASQPGGTGSGVVKESGDRRGASAVTRSSQSSEGGGFDPNPEHPDYFDFFHLRSECESFNTYPPGVVQSVVDIACTPPFIPSPYGEISDLAAKLAENDAAIAQIGPGIPVLLAAGDHDTTAPPEKVRADLGYYKAHCGCDVSSYTIPSSGHLYQVHKSLPQFVDEVVTWLRTRGLAPGTR